MTIQRIRAGQGHWYKIDGVKAEGVTTVLKILPKDLSRWGATTVADFAIDHPGRLAEMIRDNPDSAREFLRNLPNEARKKAAVRGTQIHSLAEKLAHGEAVDVPPHLAGHVSQYVRFLDEWEPKTLCTERVVASRKYKHCGTADGALEFPKHCDSILAGKRVMIDVKSGNYLYDEMALQLAAYRWSDTMLDNQGNELPMIETDTAAVIHVEADGYEVVPVTAMRKQYDAFLKLLRAYRAVRACGFTLAGKKLKGTPDLILEPLPTPTFSDPFNKG